MDIFYSVYCNIQNRSSKKSLSLKFSLINNDPHSAARNGEIMTDDITILSTKSIAEEVKVLVNEKPYNDPELNLPSLAKALDLSVHHLSQVINHDQNSNFYDFINRYRIDEVKQQLTDRYRAEQSILTLAFAAGFNSKATFNRIFKEQTKQTPSQYRKSSKPI